MSAPTNHTPTPTHGMLAVEPHGKHHREHLGHDAVTVHSFGYQPGKRSPRAERRWAASEAVRLGR